MQRQVGLGSRARVSGLRDAHAQGEAAGRDVTDLILLAVAFVFLARLLHLDARRRR